MKVVKQIRSDNGNILNVKDPTALPDFSIQTDTEGIEKQYDIIFAKVGQELNASQYTYTDPYHYNDPKSVFDTSTPLYGKEITDETLETAAEMLLYIMSPQDINDYWTNWHITYYNWSHQTSSLLRLLSKLFSW